MSKRQGRSIYALPLMVSVGLTLSWIALALLTWGDLQNGVRVSTPFATFGYGQSALFSHPIHVGQILATFLWNFLGAFVGYYYVIRPIWGGKGLAASPWMLWAGIVPGCFLIGAVTRLLTLVFDNQSAAWLIAAVVIAASAFALQRLNKDAAASRTSAFGWQATSVWLLLAMIAALIFQIHMDRSHAIAEGSIWFVNEIFLSAEYGIGTGGHFPLIAQHYDEAAFLHALVFLTVSPGDDASATLTSIYWQTLAFNRVGIIALTYIALRALRLDQLSAIASTFFICFASLSLNVFSSRLLFDSLSPMAYTLHMSRFLAPVMPLLIVAALTRSLPSLNTSTLCTALLLGIGLAATPIHFVSIAFWAGGIVFIYSLVNHQVELPRQSFLWVVLGVLSTVSLAYLLKDISGLASVGLLVSGSILGGAILLWCLWKAGFVAPKLRSKELAAVGIFIVLMSGYVVALIFLGNIAIPFLEPIFENNLWSERDVLVRLGGAVVAPEVSLRTSPYCSTGSSWGFRTLMGHCGSLPLFVRTYGLPFVLIAAALSWRAYSVRAERIRETLRIDQFTVWGMVLCLLALPLSFVLFDFVTPDGSDEFHAWSIWLRSRLVEPWFISGVLLALAYLQRTLDAQRRLWLNSVLLVAVGVYVLNPLIAPSQWSANVAYFWTTVF